MLFTQKHDSFFICHLAVLSHLRASISLHPRSLRASAEPSRASARHGEAPLVFSTLCILKTLFHYPFFLGLLKYTFGAICLVYACPAFRTQYSHDWHTGMFHLSRIFVTLSSPQEQTDHDLRRSSRFEPAGMPYCAGSVQHSSNTKNRCYFRYCTLCGSHRCTHVHAWP